MTCGVVTHCELHRQVNRKKNKTWRTPIEQYNSNSNRNSNSTATVQSRRKRREMFRCFGVGGMIRYTLNTTNIVSYEQGCIVLLC